MKETTKGYKRCAKCREIKALYEFDKHAKTRDGRGSYCHACRKVYANTYRKQHSTKKEKVEKEKIILSAEEKLLKRMEYGWIPRKSHTQKCDKCLRMYAIEVMDSGRCAVCRRKKDKKVITRIGRPKKYKNSKERALANHAHSKAAKHRRRALERQGHFTAKEWLELVEKYNYTCLCCKATNKRLEADHVIPLSKGGSNSIDNIQPLCAECNNKKGVQETDYRLC